MSMKEINNAKSLKIIIIFLIIVIVILGVYFSYYILKSKNISNNTKNDLNNNIQNQNPKLENDKIKSVQKGTLLKNETRNILVNNNEHIIKYINEIDENGAGKIYISYDNTIVYNLSGASDIELTYEVFNSVDNKEYVIIKYKQWGYNLSILNENGIILDKLSEYNNELECYNVINDNYENTRNMQIFDNNLYFYLYKDGTYIESDSSIKLEEYKLSIINNQIIKKTTGNVIDGSIGQCN